MLVFFCLQAMLFDVLPVAEIDAELRDIFTRDLGFPCMLRLNGGAVSLMRTRLHRTESSLEGARLSS